MVEIVGAVVFHCLQIHGGTDVGVVVGYLPCTHRLVERSRLMGGFNWENEIENKALLVSLHDHMLYHFDLSYQLDKLLFSMSPLSGLKQDTMYSGHYKEERHYKPH